MTPSRSPSRRRSEAASGGHPRLRAGVAALDGGLVVQGRFGGLGQDLWYAALACCLAAAPPAFADAPRSSEPGQNVGFLTNKDIDTRRQQAGFRRSYDGRVAIQNKSTQEWLDAKCDLQVGLGLWLAGKGGAAAGAGAPARSTLERMGAGRAGAHPPPPAAAGAAQMRCITAAWRDRRHGVTGSSSARS